MLFYHQRLLNLAHWVFKFLHYFCKKKITLTHLICNCSFTESYWSRENFILYFIYLYIVFYYLQIHWDKSVFLTKQETQRKQK